MKLRERFKQWLDTNPRLQIREVQLEVIADEHAIEFAIFTKEYNYHSGFNVWIHSFDLIGQRFTSKQLIEKFKTEKGL